MGSSYRQVRECITVACEIEVKNNSVEKVVFQITFSFNHPEASESIIVKY